MKMLKIYLDNCCYNRPFDNQAQLKIRLETEAKLHIQQCIRNDLFILCWSFVLDYENSKNPFKDKQNAIAPWKNFAKDYCSENEHILAHATEIMKLDIREMDALHIACAINRNCDYFITTDRKLTKRIIDNVNIVNPIDFVIEMENLS